MPNRTLCDVFEEMRKCHETYNFAPMLGLIEEAQSMANRMEAALFEQEDYRIWCEKVKREKAALKALLKKTNRLRRKVGEEEKTFPRH